MADGRLTIGRTSRLPCSLATEILVLTSLAYYDIETRPEIQVEEAVQGQGDGPDPSVTLSENKGPQSAAPTALAAPSAADEGSQSEFEDQPQPLPAASAAPAPVAPPRRPRIARGSQSTAPAGSASSADTLGDYVMVPRPASMLRPVGLRNVVLAERTKKDDVYLRGERAQLCWRCCSLQTERGTGAPA
jgi:hypothetical protein